MYNWSMAHAPDKVHYQDWKIIYENDCESQFEIAVEVRRQHNLRKSKLEEVGLPSNVAPLLQCTAVTC